MWCVCKKEYHQLLLMQAKLLPTQLQIWLEAVSNTRHLPRRIAHCNWWPMIDSHGSLWTSTSLKRNIFHRHVCPWTLMILYGLPWKSMFLPWNPMNVHVHSWTFIANFDWVSSATVRLWFTYVCMHPFTFWFSRTDPESKMPAGKVSHMCLV